MNFNVAQKRMSDVLRVDSINNSQADFLATHVPFRRISVTDNLTENSVSSYLSENDILSKYFTNDSVYNKHQFIIVEGSSGSGKSHFIRWIQAKLDSFEDLNDVIIMIRRSDNTLKGTIKQFLDRDEVKNLKNKDIYERLVNANQSISETKFKYKIYHEFLVEIEADESDFILGRTTKRNLKELLSSSDFEDKMLRAGGPIDRIYGKIATDGTHNNEDEVALFDVSDFTLDIDFCQDFKNSASKKAVKMANALLETEDSSDSKSVEVTTYMNSLVDSVIQSCAGIQPGDFQQIFKEIRKELYKQGKNLILLIEDITSCTGINQDLLNALIVEHTGLNESDKMCRLLSVIGTTSEYFAEFRDNYIGRITARINIEDGALGNNKEDLVLFVAKYLNVVSLEKDVINSWYISGAEEKDYPVHEKQENAKWGYCTYQNKKLSLYPLNRNSIINIYDALEISKTPRHIMRRIIEPAINNVLDDKYKFPHFLTTMISDVDYRVTSRVKGIVNNLKIDVDKKEEYANRVLAIVRFWGDGTLDKKDGKNNIGGIGNQIFAEFGLGAFSNNILGGSVSDDYIEEEYNDNLSSNNGEDNIVPPAVKVEKKKNKKFDDFMTTLNDWHFDKKVFIRARVIRDVVCKFIYDSISWQRYGVPLIEKNLVNDSNYNLVEIVRQDRAAGKGLFVLEDNDENYQFLLSLGKYEFEGDSSWNIDDAASSIRIVTSWLNKNTSKIIKAVKEYSDVNSNPGYIKCALLVELYRSILNGEISKTSDISHTLFLRNSKELKCNVGRGHCDKWINFVEKILYQNDDALDNIQLIQNYYNLIQGNKVASTYVIDYLRLNDAFKELKKHDYSLLEDYLDQETIGDKTKPQDRLKRMIEKIDSIIEDELVLAKNVYAEINKHFEYSDGFEIEENDLKGLFDEMIDFYDDVDKSGINIDIKTQKIKEYRDKAKLLASNLRCIHKDYSNINKLEILLSFSTDPICVAKDFLNLLNDVECDVENVSRLMSSEKEKLTRSGNWEDNEDPRFSKYSTELYSLLGKEPENATE